MSTGALFISMGTALALLFWNLAEHGGRIGTPGHLTRLAVAAVIYAAAVNTIRRGRLPSRVVLLACLGLALGARIPLVLRPAGPADDTHRYLWDARLQRAGLNPYVVRPNDPAFDALQTPATRMMNNPDVPSPYPPGAQYFFRLVTAVGESATAVKAALVAAEMVTLASMWAWLIRRGRHPAWTLVYAWHPVAIFETASAGHLDALGVMLLMVAAASLSREWVMAGVLALAASISTKFLPLVLMPLLLRRLHWRHVAAGTVFLALLYAPFLDGGRLPTGSLGAVVDRFRFNGLLFPPLARLIGSPLAAGVAVAVGLGTAWALRRRAEAGAAWAWPMAASLLFAPVIYPWYLVWLVPFAVDLAALPLLAWSLAVIPTYRVWALAAAGHEWAVPVWILVVEYGTLVVVSAATFAAARRARFDAGSA
jgi:alpha-1,6-mannosyltransferase